MRNVIFLYFMFFMSVSLSARAGRVTVVNDRTGSKRLEGNFPSVTFDNGFCIMQNGGEMGWHGVPDGEFCRPVCVF